jgi:hypothetical protein
MEHREAIHDRLAIPSGGRFRDIRQVDGTPDDPGIEQPHPRVQITTP